MDVDPIQEFHLASEQGDYHYVCAIIKAGLDVDCRDHDNNTALHIAAANDHESIVTILLDNGANYEATNNLGWTPLMQAARHGHMTIVRHLLQAGCPVDTTNRLGMTALMLASVSGHMGTIRVLIEAKADYDPKHTLNPCQVTPLMIAAHNGNDAVVRLYLDKGVTANKPIPKTGITALMFSAAGGNLSTTKILLDRGADVNSLNVFDMTAYDVAVATNRPHISSFLQTRTTILKKDWQCDLMEASRRGNIKAVQEILLNDPNQIHINNPDGATPLMMAAMMGYMQVAQTLLQYGAYIDAQDYRNGWTSLMQAIYHRHSNMAILLIQYGADLTLSTHQGYTAFDFASEMLDTDIMKIFVQAQLPGLSASSPQPNTAMGAAQGHRSQAGQRSHIQSDQSDISSKLGIKHWWNRVSNKFHKARGVRGSVVNVGCDDNDAVDMDMMTTLPPIHYDPILPQQIPLTPIMDFGGDSNFVVETMRSMVPPHISPTGCVLPTAMPPGRKILPGTSHAPPRHATNSRLLKWNISSSTSPGSSLSVPSPHSSGEGGSLGAYMFKMRHNQNKNELKKNMMTKEKSQEGNVGDMMLLSINSDGDSATSSLKTVTSSKSSRSTGTLVPDNGEASDPQKKSDQNNRISSENTTKKVPHKNTGADLGLSGGQNLTMDLGLSGVLEVLGLSEYLSVFVEQEVDLEALMELSDADLKDLGISPLTARRAILSATQRLKAQKYT